MCLDKNGLFLIISLCERDKAIFFVVKKNM